MDSDRRSLRDVAPRSVDAPREGGRSKERLVEKPYRIYFDGFVELGLGRDDTGIHWNLVATKSVAMGAIIGCGHAGFYFGYTRVGMDQFSPSGAPSAD